MKKKKSITILPFGFPYIADLTSLCLVASGLGRHVALNGLYTFRQEQYVVKEDSGVLTAHRLSIILCFGADESEKLLN